MDKVDEMFLHSFPKQTYANPAIGKDASDPGSNIEEVYIEDRRVARLLVLLEQLEQSTGGLAALPESELSEVVLSAVRLCGFVDELEARDVLAAVLAGIEKQDDVPEASCRPSELDYGD